MYRYTLFAFATKIQLQQTINKVDSFIVPLVSLPPQNLKQFRETVSWIFSAAVCNAKIADSSRVLSGR